MKQIIVIDEAPAAIDGRKPMEWDAIDPAQAEKLLRDARQLADERARMAGGDSDVRASRSS
ncbi:hypothetical protein [Saccharopolyspora pogona]|uniref:hypothetical protein n=1 Tax=Saccharopolyspora pogona TaxID=333966 RepID=UPI0016886B71|nr:hypothetical protein [Saccharopolyspora pogona]